MYIHSAVGVLLLTFCCWCFVVGVLLLVFCSDFAWGGGGGGGLS